MLTKRVLLRGQSSRSPESSRLRGVARWCDTTALPYAKPAAWSSPCRGSS